MFSAITSYQNAGNGVTFPHFGYHLEATVVDNGEEMQDELSESIFEIYHHFQAYEAISCRSF